MSGQGGAGGGWGGDGVILIASTSNGPIYRVPASSGQPQPVTTLNSTRGETAHRYPQFLPDGRHFLFSVLPAREGEFEIYAGSLDSPKRQLVLTAGTGVTWAPPGHLLYERDGKLIAQGFDPNTLKLRGDPVALGDAVSGTGGSGGPIASASATGSVSYATFHAQVLRLAWFDHSGREIATVPVRAAPARRRRCAGRSALRATADRGGGCLRPWIADLERGVATRFTDEPGEIEAADWSPDGTRIAYLWSQNSPQVLKIKTLVRDTLETFLDEDPLFKRLGAGRTTGAAFSTRDSTRRRSGTSGAPRGRRPHAPRLPEDAFQRVQWLALARWPVDGLPVRRVGGMKPTSSRIRFRAASTRSPPAADSGSAGPRRARPSRTG